MDVAFCETEDAQQTVSGILLVYIGPFLHGIFIDEINESSRIIYLEEEKIGLSNLYIAGSNFRPFE